MNKAELIDYIASKQNCIKKEAEKIIDIFTDSVTNVLGEGKEITLIGFGKFYATQVTARDGHNPKTREKIHIPAYVQPKFSAGAKLKSVCNPNKKK